MASHITYVSLSYMHDACISAQVQERSKLNLNVRLSKKYWFCFVGLVELCPDKKICTAAQTVDLGVRSVGCLNRVKHTVFLDVTVTAIAFAVYAIP